METAEQILVSKKINPTAMRLTVLKEMMNTDYAVSLNELEVLLDTADKTTIYRTLKTFEKNKIVHSIEDGSGALKYAVSDEEERSPSEESHLHFHCNRCSRTFCIRHFEVPSVKLPKNFSAEETSLMVKGLCDKCH